MTGPELPPRESLYENAPVALLLTDEDGRILRANDTASRWLLMPTEHLCGRRFQDLLTVGGRIFHQTHWAPLLRLQGSVSEVKLELVAGDGRKIPVMVNAVRSERARGVVHQLALFVAHDRNAYERELMLARRRAEDALARQMAAQRALVLADANLKLALESADLYLWGADPDSGARTYEARVALLLGLPEGAFPDERGFLSAIPEQERTAEAAQFSALLAGSRASARWEHGLTVAGQRRHVRVSARRIEADGAPALLVGVIQDITQLAAQRAAAEDRALLAEQMMGIVSHDLRNPLAAILTGSTALQRVELPTRVAATLGHITNAARRARRMIDELLDFTAARMGRGISFAPRALALHDVVAAAVTELGAAYPAAELVHERAGQGPCRADADRLAQLTGNLVSNAIKYGSATPVTVRSELQDGACTISVHNYGPPIREAERASLFLPMVRGERDDRGTRSLGLGLYIVAEIARVHGGQIQVASDEASGTTFRFDFPSELPSPSAPVAQ